MSKLKDGTYVPCADSVNLRSCCCGNVHVDLKDAEGNIYATFPADQELWDRLNTGFPMVLAASKKEKEEFNGTFTAH